MPSTRALLYPACYPRHRSASLVSLFMEELLVLAPSEDSAEIIGQIDEINSMHITPFLPSPLGDRLEDFQNGLKALEAWGEQLGLGGNTGFETLYSAIETSENEAIQGIIGAIRGGGSKEDLLLASRVFLRLSIDADQRMDQLNRELERVEKDQNRISQLVEGLKDAGQAEGTRRCFIEPLNRARERLKTWTRLFFSAAESPQAFWPLGESITVKDLMDAAYESLTGGRAPLEPAALTVPVHLDEKCIGKAAEEIRHRFSGLLHMISAQEDAADISSLTKDIQEALETNCGPVSNDCQARIVVSMYPGYSWQDVLLKAAGLGEKDAHSSPKEAVSGSIFLV